MPTTPQQYTDLFNRLLQKKLSPQDTDALIEWLGADAPDLHAAEMIMQQLNRSSAAQELSPEITASLDARLQDILSKPSAARIRLFPPVWLRYAAVFILLFGVSAYWWYNNKPQAPIAVQKAQPAVNDVAPGTQGAILTLADGSTVVLDSTGNGLVASQNGSKLVLANGQLKYEKEGHTLAAETYNTMSTPKGRMFGLILPDGSKVWLNAASSLKYPTVFTGKERKVVVTGEAYFEIAANAGMPFHVSVNGGTDIEVMGTHFNINSYEDESNVNITLLEGAVKCINGNERTILRPGQQARIAEGEQQRIHVINNADMDRVMAWKNGIFNFNDASLEEVMRQLERWYNIEVVYEKGVPKLEFIGKMGRDLTLSEVLTGLEMSKVHFRIESGRRLIIMP